MIHIENFIFKSRAIKNMKSHSDTSHLPTTQSGRKERVLDLDGTLTTKAVVEHKGMSIWPGRNLR